LPYSIAAIGSCSGKQVLETMQASWMGLLTATANPAMAHVIQKAAMEVHCYQLLASQFHPMALHSSRPMVRTAY
jgi:hypothetical protein